MGAAVLAGCNAKTADCDTIDLSQSSEKVCMADYIEPVAFVELEENDSCLLRDITKVQQTADAFYVMDGSADKLYKFNPQGRFIRAISNQGQGPAEYLRLEDFTVSRCGDSIYICSAPSEVKVFDPEGHFCAGYAVDSEAPLTELNATDQGFVMAADNLIECANRFYGLDNGFNVITSSCPRNCLPSATPCRQSRSAGGSGYFLNWADNTFYTCDSAADTIRPFLNLHLPNDIQTSGIKDFMTFMERQHEVGYVINWAISDNTIIVYASCNGSPRIMIFDKESKQILHRGDLAGYIPDLHKAADGNTFISCVTPDNYRFFENGLPADCGLPPFVDGQTNAILMLWKVK